jgi:peptidoglycan/xylan/chitin deacetylase (PgdA/CDA1 family)
MRRETFERRMKLLKKLGLPVLGLDEAVHKLSSRELPAMATVITIDDGWYGTYLHMLPILRELELPATLYVATAFVESNFQVYNVAIRYVLWRHRDKSLQARAIRDGALSRDYDLAVPEQRREAERELIRFGFGYPDFEERHAVWREVCDALNEDWKAIESERRLAFVNREELRQMIEDGLDVQLHTHGHRFPSGDREDAIREVVSNREYLNTVSSGEYSHFCYPSGQYEADQIDDLRSLGVVSATTTIGGFNRHDTPVYELRRLIDVDRKSDLEFEARISGVMEIIASTKHALRKVLTAPSGNR